MRERLSDREVVNLTLAIVAINGWNRVGIARRPALVHDAPARSAA